MTAKVGNGKLPSTHQNHRNIPQEGKRSSLLHLMNSNAPYPIPERMTCPMSLASGRLCTKRSANKVFTSGSETDGERRRGREWSTESLLVECFPVCSVQIFRCFLNRLAPARSFAMLHWHVSSCYVSRTNRVLKIFSFSRWKGENAAKAECAALAPTRPRWEMSSSMLEIGRECGPKGKLFAKKGETNPTRYSEEAWYIRDHTKY